MADGSTQRISVQAFRVLLLDDGTWWLFPRRPGESEIRRIEPSGHATKLGIPSELARPLDHSVIGDEFAVFVDSLAEPEPTEFGSRLQVAKVTTQSNPDRRSPCRAGRLEMTSSVGSILRASSSGRDRASVSGGHPKPSWAALAHTPNGWRSRSLRR